VTFDEWLKEREEYWRREIGDEAWETAVDYWHARLTCAEEPPSGST
jgi:hypothetical protein